MSVLDSFFNKGAFKAARCKTLLKLTIPRIKLLRNRREMHLKQMRREIAKLLENGQEATARIRVEHIIREENMMAAQEIIELFCELITVRLPIIESQRECPLDLKEAISSICFAAPRCADLPELQQVQMLFAAKYGREFAVAATELMPDSGVNRQIIELLSIRAPPVEIKMKLLKEIAEEHEVDWDPTATESEFLKPHEDLLNGPGRFISGSKLPLPDEKHKDSLSSAPSRPTHEDSEGESDTGSDLDLPEVPKASIRSSSVPIPDPDTVDSNSESDPAIVQTFPPAATSDLVFKPNITLDALAVGSEPSTASVHIPPTSAVDVKGPKQFIPFVSSPPSPDAPLSVRPHETVPSFSLPSPSPTPVPPLSCAKAESEANIDLDDVLAAAQAAAESAERAAAAARAAASLAKVRISELTTRRNSKASEKGENEFLADSSIPRDVVVKQESDRQHLSFDTPMPEPESPSSSDHQYTHQPVRSTSLEDDSYFSYPNLFSRQNSERQTTVADNSRSSHEP